MSPDFNPYAAQDLFVPKQWHDSYQRYTTLRRSEGRDTDGAPFPRMIDMWWAALGIGVRGGQRSPLGQEPVKFADGAILGSDPWRITHLGLIAIVEEGEEILTRPSDVIRIACEFAATGSDLLVETMAGHARPLKPLASMLRDLLSSA